MSLFCAVKKFGVILFWKISLLF